MPDHLVLLSVTHVASRGYAIWDSKRLVNMADANRAREAIVVWEPDLLSALPGLRPDAILLICGMSGADLLSAYGLHRSDLSTRKDESS